MTAGRKLSVTLQMSQTVRDLALAGIRSRFPGAGRRPYHQGARLDRTYLTAQAPTLGVSDLLDRALQSS